MPKKPLATRTPKKPTIEARLERLETEVAQLKRTRTADEDVPWYEKIFGSFAGDKAFEEAMKLGREYRESFGRRKGTARKRRNGRS